MACKRAMKAKRCSVIAKGPRARASVFSGKKLKTRSGLTKDSLVKNKFGKIVSKKKSVLAKQRYDASGLRAWADAVHVARAALGLCGFVPIGGPSEAGQALYAEAKSRLCKRVSLLTANRRRYMLDMKGSDSMGDVKAKSEEMFGILGHRQTVEEWRGEIMLYVFMRIFVATLGNPPLLLDVDALDTVESVSRQVARQFDCFKLMFNMRELLADEILHDVGIVDGSVITLVRLSGPSEGEGE